LCPSPWTWTWADSTPIATTSLRQWRSNPAEWRKELPLIEEWFEFVGDKLPTGVKDEFEALKQRLSEAS
jgi:GTP-dependent phosphoenolpyruvate carboxykinase